MHHVFYLASHFDALYNGIAAQSDTFSSHKKSPARASPNDRANRRHRGRLRTVANGCERLRTVAVAQANFGEHLQPPDPQLINGNPLLRIREKYADWFPWHRDVSQCAGPPAFGARLTGWGGPELSSGELVLSPIKIFWRSIKSKRRLGYMPQQKDHPR